MSPVPLPLSPAYALIALALPGVWLLGRATAEVLVQDRTARAALGPALALASWIMAAHACSLAAGSFAVGLPVGTLGVALAGAVAERRRRRHADAIPAPTGEPPSAWMLATMALSALALARAAVGFWFHDELLPVGHMSISSEIQNGIYPPRNLMFPELPLRYHYGFDLLTAALATVFRLGTDAAIDVATVALWCLAWCLLWALGARLGPRGTAWLTPVVVLFGGGAAVGCDDARASPVWAVLVECRVGKSFSLNGPVVSYFFQHPWGLGVPLAIAAVLVIDARPKGRPIDRLAVLAVLFAALSFAEVVLFVGLLPAAIVAEARRDGRWSLRDAGRMTAVVAIALLAAKLLGGFFASSRALPGLAFELHAGYTNDLASTLSWNARTFAVLGVLGVVGLFTRAPHRLLLGLLALGSVVVVNAVRYAASADILKFATLAAIALGVLAAAALSRLLAGPGRRAARTAVAAALALGATFQGLFFLGCFVIAPKVVPDVMRREPERLTPDDVAAMSFVRERVRAGELVYRALPASSGYAQWGGLPEPWVDWTASAFGVPAARTLRRRLLLRSTAGDVRSYAAEGFRWIVVDPTRDGALRVWAETWIAKGTARLAATFGALRVVEIL